MSKCLLLLELLQILHSFLATWKASVLLLTSLKQPLLNLNVFTHPWLLPKSPCLCLLLVCVLGGGRERDLMFKLLQPSSFSVLLQSHLDAPVGRNVIVTLFSSPRALASEPTGMDSVLQYKVLEQLCPKESCRYEIAMLAIKVCTAVLHAFKYQIRNSCAFFLIHC